MNKELTTLVKRLKRIFPHVTLQYEGESFFNDKSEKGSIETDFAPPREYDWFDIIKKLKDNGLEIKNIKETKEIPFDKFKDLKKEFDIFNKKNSNYIYFEDWYIKFKT